jgi:tripartite-type tricarboxylate transporter receptor subunit TctC
MPNPLNRRTFALALGACTLPSLVLAQSEPWPSRAIKLVVPTAPGGTTDRLARMLALELSKSLGQPVVIDNRAGAGNSVGTALVAKAPADGYTLLFTGIFNTINPGLYPKLPYDYISDFVHVAPMTQGPIVLVARPDFSASTLAQLVALAKAKPGGIDFASGGSGTSGHLTMELFQRTANVKLNHVAYKGAAPALQDVLAGVVPMIALNQDTMLPLVKAGKLKAIAVTSQQRNALFADVPTFVEGGFTDMVVTSWAGLDAPKGTPAAIVERLNTATFKALQLPEMKQRLEADGWQVFASSPREFDTFVRGETERWTRVIKAANIQLE